MRQTLNINKLIICSVAAAVVSATVFTGCGYKPEDGKIYYDNGDTYRVIELEESKTEYIENYGVESYHVPLEGVANLSAKSEGVTQKNTVYYDVIDNLSCEALQQVYKVLGVDNYPKIVDEVEYYASSGLCTRNEIKVYGTITSDSFTKYYEGGQVIGLIADVHKYTINYTDCLKNNGEVVSSGSFCVMLVDSVEVSLFNYDEFTDLYSVKGAAND